MLKQNPRNARRNALSPERRDGLLLMCHEHVTHAPGELLEIGKTAAGPNLVLQHAPEAFHGIKVMAAPGWQALQPKSCMPMGQGRCERVRAVDALRSTTITTSFPVGPNVAIT